jgi:DNA-binding CsgD family transcriptional regulator
MSQDFSARQEGLTPPNNQSAARIPSDNSVLISNQPHLTPAEREVAELILQAKPRREIAQALKCDIYTVTDCVGGMYRKFDLRNDGIHCRLVHLALLLHERRAEFGIQCEACGDRISE